MKRQRVNPGVWTSAEASWHSITSWLRVEVFRGYNKLCYLAVHTHMHAQRCEKHHQQVKETLWVLPLSHSHTQMNLESETHSVTLRGSRLLINMQMHDRVHNFSPSLCSHAHMSFSRTRWLHLNLRVTGPLFFSHWASAHNTAELCRPHWGLVYLLLFCWALFTNSCWSVYNDKLHYLVTVKTPVFPSLLTGNSLWCVCADVSKSKILQMWVRL